MNSSDCFCLEDLVCSTIKADHNNEEMTQQRDNTPLGLSCEQISQCMMRKENVEKRSAKSMLNKSTCH